MGEYKTVESHIPARLDRLPFRRWHVMIILALGVTWILDGLEVTIVGSIASFPTEPESGLNLTAGQIGLANGLGCIGGACFAIIFFASSSASAAYLDRHGQRHEPPLRLPHRRGRHDRGGRHGGSPRRQCRAAVAGERRFATDRAPT